MSFPRVFVCALLGVTLAACDPVPTTAPTGGNTATPQIAPPSVATPSETSRALSAYYGRLERNLLAQGLLRADGGGPDVPFTHRQLVENFVRIALYEEFTTVGGRLVARQTPSRLHRWEAPIRMQVEFGASVPEAQREKDRGWVANFGNRLSRLTGLPIAQVDTGANYHVMILNEDERRVIGPRLRQIVPGLSQSAVDTVQNMPRSTFCLVFAVDGAEDGVYTKAVAIVRGEHPDLLRLSCLHEEIAQGLGLSNDSPAARPTVFNDDEEFGLLTGHDELMLRILYDRRLTIGMTASQARPIVEVIASELLPGQS